MKQVTANAPSSSLAEEAVRAELGKRSIAFLSVQARPTAPRPDKGVAIVVTKPAGKRSTFMVRIILAEEV